jgi:hypothetical protein
MRVVSLFVATLAVSTLANTATARELGTRQGKAKSLRERNAHPLLRELQGCVIQGINFATT